MEATYSRFNTFFLVTVTGIKFDSKYGGKSVHGAVGSSVTFTWSFSGGVGRVDWGLKQTGLNDIIRLVSLANTGAPQPIDPPVPDAYSQRVSGKFIGDASSGQASFTLVNLTQSDERLFGCSILSTGFPITVFDQVQLFIQGEYLRQMQLKQDCDHLCLTMIL